MGVISAVTGLASACAARQPSSPAPQSETELLAGWEGAGAGFPEGAGLLVLPASLPASALPGWRRVKGGELAAAGATTGGDA
ncbi:MAG TPA: hypothetical protein VE673_09090, partial [Pseudonocardiaceae bacterium]|nr:hypothetical protein [Pseudonocardiaceae bacterium]